MSTLRIALANIQSPPTPEESVTLAERAIAQASIERADVICFPECFVPGYRGMGKRVPPPDPAFLERAWSVIAAAAAKADLAVILGTERVVDGALLISALVINRDGTVAGFQDKVQIDPSEEVRIRPALGGASSFADPVNSFHEKAALCRAAENTIFFATVNFASTGSPTTSAVVRPDGTLLSYQPYGERGLLIADIDIAEATGLLAARSRSF